MDSKLPVKTFRFSRKTKPVLYATLFLSLLLAAALFKLTRMLEYGQGRLVILLLSIMMMIVFAFILVAIIRLTRDHYIAMFISTKGINDISTGHTYGMVQWKNVTKIKVMSELENPKRSYIVLRVRNPQEYIDREIVGHKKRSLILKFHQYGTPICFSNRALDCSFDELLETVRTYYDAYLSKVQSTESK